MLLVWKAVKFWRVSALLFFIRFQVLSKINIFYTEDTKLSGNKTILFFWLDTNIELKRKRKKYNLQRRVTNFHPPPY